MAELHVRQGVAKSVHELEITQMLKPLRTQLHEHCTDLNRLSSLRIIGCTCTVCFLL